MPLRSVEAATRDDAIAAAREQFGPSARVVGVRRVRSGGVLGFFATERYVAEVAPDATKPAVPPDRPCRTTPGRRLLGRWPPAASRRARPAAAPARNGAAAWAAEAARAEAPARSSAASRSAAPATRRHGAGLVAGARQAPGGRRAGQRVRALLAAKQRGPTSPAYGAGRLPARLGAPDATTPAYPATCRSRTRSWRRWATAASSPPTSRTRRRPSPPRSRGWWPATGTSARRSRRHSSAPARPAPEQGRGRPDRAHRRVSGAVFPGAAGGGTGGRSGRRALLDMTQTVGRCRTGRPSPRSPRRRAPRGRRRSPRCCATRSPRVTPTRRSPGSCARCWTARRRRARWPTRWRDRCSGRPQRLAARRRPTGR